MEWSASNANASKLSINAKPAAHSCSWHNAENMLISIFQLLFSSFPNDVWVLKL